MKRALVSVLGIVALLATGFSIIPGGTSAMIVEVEFERTFNLFPQSPVRVRGVEVGVVSAVETDPSSGLVDVTLRLEPETDVPADANAVIITSALLGERYVQLTGGTEEERLADGDRIPVERTIVPFEFDEVLEGLNDFVGGLDEDEVGRLVTNLADLLDGQGAQLGTTIDAAGGAIAALKDNDEDLLALASAVSDLNETLATRDTELAALLDDWIRVSDTLTAESTDLDGALDGLLVLTRELAELMAEHRTDLSDDLDTLTRVGRTASRNLDQASVAVLGAAELFRHAERVIDRERNMLPLVNHSAEIVTDLEDSLLNRLEGLCLGAGGDEESCDLGTIEDLLDSITGPITGGGGGGELCFEPLVPCTESSATVADVIVGAVRQNPAIGEQLAQQRAERAAAADAGDGDAEEEATQGAIDEALERLGLLGTGGGR